MVEKSGDGGPGPPITTIMTLSRSTLSNSVFTKSSMLNATMSPMCVCVWGQSLRLTRRCTRYRSPSSWSPQVEERKAGRANPIEEAEAHYDVSWKNFCAKVLDTLLPAGPRHLGGKVLRAIAILRWVGADVNATLVALLVFACPWAAHTGPVAPVAVAATC